MCLRAIALIFVVVSLFAEWTVSLPQKDQMIKGTGNFHIDGFFPITTNKAESKVDIQSGVMMAEAMQYAVERVNNETDYLQGYKLKINKVYDCPDEKFVRHAIFSSHINHVGFLIGPYSSETSYISSILTDTFTLLAFSYSATYGDFGRFGVMQDFMYRTVPSDEFRILAILNFIKESHWNYVSVISSNGYDGERDAVDFISKLSDYSVCLSSHINLPKYKNNKKSYLDAVLQTHREKRLKAIILFTTNEDTRNIFQVLKSKGLQNRFQIFCVYGCTNYVNVLKGYEDVVNNTINLYLHNSEVPEFKKYFLSRKPGDPNEPKYFTTFWENVFQCSLDKSDLNGYSRHCNGSEQLSETKGYYAQTPVYTVIDAVFNLAKALKLFIYKYCNKQYYKFHKIAKSICVVNANDTLITERMQKVVMKDLIFYDGTFKTKEYGHLDLLEKAFEYNVVRYDVSHYRYFKDGNSENRQIWQWNFTRSNNTRFKDVERNNLFVTQWKNSGGPMEEGFNHNGVCSSTCPAGFYMDYDQDLKKSKCCWDCRACSSNSKITNNTCITCKKTEFVDDKYESCLSLPIKELKWRANILSIIFVLFTVLGLCLTASVGIVFTVFSKNRIVRASGRDLCYIILAGICLTFICLFAFLVETNQITCILRGAFPGFAFLTCYAPLFLKTNRIYRIFSSARISVTKPSLIGSESQFFALFAVLTVQLIISVVWFTSQTPVPTLIVAADCSHVTIHCSSDANPILLILNLSLSVLFMVCCTVLAFKTRHFPKNYNEAKYIGITLYVTCVAWAVFLPTYFLSTNITSEFLGEYLMCAQCILIGYITLFGMFGPKIIMIFQSLPPQPSSQERPTSFVAGRWLKDDSNDDGGSYDTPSRENNIDTETTTFTTIVQDDKKTLEI